MLTVKGIYSDAVVFSDDIEESAYSQIVQLVNHPIAKQAHIRIMPDVHTGKGCVIGYTAKLGGIVIPNLIGVDIGCGVLSFYFVNLKLDNKAFDRIDSIIRTLIPSGTRIRGSFSDYVYVVSKMYMNMNFDEFKKRIEKLAYKTKQDINYVLNSLGSLGSGNHFIEIEVADELTYFTVHSGSRNFGLNVANYHQKKAKNIIKKDGIPLGMEYLEGKDAKEYMEDMETAQIYARINRYAMLYTIIKNFTNEEEAGIIESVHNYINFSDGIVRKGAISAHKKEKVVIPLNMADGLIVGEGLGSREWNYSAPHGAGRKMSRRQARKILSMKEFRKKMEGVYSSCVGQKTIDESPMAYKDKNRLLNYLKETVKITHIAKPVYNFKAG